MTVLREQPMTNRLTTEQSEKVNALLNEIRVKLQKMSAGDPKLLFSYRRRIFIRLTHDERGTPTHRRKLKQLKMTEQAGKCAICEIALPDTEAELDRFEAWLGYTPENTQLVHHDCHRRQQRERGFGKSSV
jgi:hypothetical protein